MSLREKLDPLFYPKSVAIVGASNNPAKWGFHILHNLLLGEFEGNVYPVNPHGGEILGLQSYPSLQDLPESPDLTTVCVPSKVVPSVVDDVIAKGGKTMFVISSGFGEAGEAEAKLQNDLAQKVENAGIVMGGPNGQGLASSECKLYCLMAGVYNKPGPISVVSQSGNVGGTLMHWADYHGFGINKFISSGNEASLRLHDIIRYYGEDPTTKVVAVYLENLRDGKAFLEACREVVRKKPVILLRGGRTAAGSLAARSHTGAMATATDVFNAACRQAGVIQVGHVREMFETAIAFAYQPLPRGKRVAIATLGGGWGVLAADGVAEHGLELPPLNDEIINKLSEFLPPYWSRNNPVDLVATRQLGALARVLDILANWDEADALLVLGIGYGTRGVHISRNSPFKESPIMEQVVDFIRQEDFMGAEAIVRLIEECDKPILVCSDPVLGAHDIQNRPILYLEEHNILVHATPKDGARNLSHLCRYATGR